MRLLLKKNDLGRLEICGVCFVVTGRKGPDGKFTWRVEKGEMALTRYSPDYWLDEEQAIPPVGYRVSPHLPLRCTLHPACLCNLLSR